MLARGDKAVDYAAPANSNPMKLVGIKLVGRYIDPTAGTSYASWKCLSAHERDQLLNWQRAIMLIWETTATRGLEGAAAGKTDGAAAAAAAARLGYPTDQTIVVTFDTDINKANLPKAVEYWKAFKLACPHPCGIYGDWDIIGALGTVSACNWQANAAGWSWDWIKHMWRGSHPLTHIQQKAQQLGVDPGDVLRAVKVWNGPVAKPKPANPKAPIPTLKQGMHSAEVVHLQQHLAFWGWYTGGIDGIFGSGTAMGVAALQKACKVKPDGVYGPATAASYSAFLAAMQAFAKK